VPDLAVRSLPVPPPFSLAATAGPIAWAKGRWPNEDWIDRQLIWIGWENGETVYRLVRQRIDGESPLEISGSASPDLDAVWASDVLGLDQTVPVIDDESIAPLALRWSGLRPWSSGNLFDGLVGSIVGQSITVAAAATTAARLAAQFHPGIELAGRRFWPHPRPEQLAEADPARVRETGVTWRRAEALVIAGKEAAAGRFPTEAEARTDPIAARTRLLELPIVGPWTAESALLWGLGLPNAFPPNDVALLRAARRLFEESELDHKGLVRRSDRWEPYRAWAARLLWTDLLGPAPL
jgi:3-methyladenine DNA glycosylase/8-oxoguanine DNA glycosylase